MDSLFQDFRYALRSVARNPGFTAVAVLTLALGIGVNAAVFSVADALLFRPLPYRSPEQLVDFIHIQEAGTPRERGIVGMTRNDVAVWRAQSHIFDAIETRRGESVVIYGDAPERNNVTQISPGMLGFLGVSPILGRSFRPEESAAGADLVVLIREDFWKNRMGGDSNVLGRTLTLNRKPHTIIGVLSSSFKFPDKNTRIWVPVPATRTPGDPSSEFVGPLGRLRSGLDLADAQRLVDDVSARLEREQPRRDGWTMRLVSLDRLRADDTTRRAMLVLLAAVGFVLLIACANVANLFLARTVSRRREIAVRAAIGASRLRLVRQFLVEGVVLASFGAALAIVAASWSIEALGMMVSPMVQAHTVFDPELNGRLATFIIGMAVVAGLASALLPALNLSKQDVQGSFLMGLRASGNGPSQRRVMQGLVLVEVALTFVLLLGAGLLANGFIRLVTADVGFDTENMLVISLDLPEDRYSTPAASALAYQQLVERLRSVQGVQEAILTGPVPPDTQFGGALVVEGEAAPPSRGYYSVSLSYVAPDHFRMLRIPVIEGRPFAAGEAASSLPVAIVDQETALRYWPKGGAVGRRIQAYPGDSWRTVVGVVGRVKLDDHNIGSPQAYVPLTKDMVEGGSIAIRVSGNAEALMEVMRQRIRDFDKEIIVSAMATAEQNYSHFFTPRRVLFTLISAFALVALALVAVGLYGVLAHFVSQRTQEIGIRIALGARSVEVRRMVTRQVLLPVGGGLVVGLGVSVWLNRFFGGLLYEVPPHDPATTAIVVLGFTLVALAAGYLPVRHATSVDPIVALRTE